MKIRLLFFLMTMISSSGFADTTPLEALNGKTFYKSGACPIHLSYDERLKQIALMFVGGNCNYLGDVILFDCHSNSTCTNTAPFRFLSSFQSATGEPLPDRWFEWKEIILTPFAGDVLLRANSDYAQFENEYVGFRWINLQYVTQPNE